MSKDFLYCVKICTPVQHVSGKSVPEYMRTPFFHCGNKSQILVYNPVNEFGIYPIPLISYKKIIVTAVREILVPFSLVLFENLYIGLVKWY